MPYQRVLKEIAKIATLQLHVYHLNYALGSLTALSLLPTLLDHTETLCPPPLPLTHQPPCVFACVCVFVCACVIIRAYTRTHTTHSQTKNINLALNT